MPVGWQRQGCCQALAHFLAVQLASREHRGRWGIWQRGCAGTEAPAWERRAATPDPTMTDTTTRVCSLVGVSAVVGAGGGELSPCRPALPRAKDPLCRHP